MAVEDREKWDARYAGDSGDSAPSDILCRYVPLASVGIALDIACGNGRNSIYLADMGFTVEAVDISSVATRRLSGRRPNIEVIRADLDVWTIPPSRYEVIVDVRFLDRRLFPMIKDGLKPGGVLFFESYLHDGTDDYCLQHNELPQVFRSLRVVHYEEKKLDPPGRFDQAASFVAIKPG